MRINKGLAVLLAASSVAMSACGGSAGGASTGSDPDTILIGTLVQNANLDDISRGWVDEINAAGGIDGRKVKLVVEEFDGDKGLAAARRLVDKEKVSAIVAYSDPGVATWGQYVASKNVPVIGGLPIDQIQTTNPNFFPIGANIYAGAYGVVSLAKTIGPKFGELHCAESAQCAGSSKLFSALAGAVGVDFAVSSKVATVGAADYTAACQALIDADVDSYTVGADGPVVLKIAEQCAKLGLKAKIVALGVTVRQSYLGSSAADGTLVADSAAPFTDASNAETKKFQALLEKIDYPSDENGPLSMYTYASLELFKKAVEQAAVPKGETVTGDDLKQGLYKLKGETLGGLTPPLTFVAGKPTLVNCFFTMGIENGKFTEPNGLKTECAPDDLIKLVVQGAASGG